MQHFAFSYVHNTTNPELSYPFQKTNKTDFLMHQNAFISRQDEAA